MEKYQSSFAHTVRQTFHKIFAPQRPTQAQPLGDTLASQTCCSAAVLSTFVNAGLESAEEIAVEQHLQECDGCLREVIALNRMHFALQDVSLMPPPGPLQAEVKIRLQPGSQPTNASTPATLRNLVIRITRQGLQYVTSLPEIYADTAILGHAVPAGALRSTTADTTAAAFLDVRQTVGNLEVHMRVHFQDEANVRLDLQVSKQGQALAQSRVAIVRDGRMLESRKTSERGELTFARLRPGAYTLKFPGENVETQCLIQAANEDMLGG